MKKNNNYFDKKWLRQLMSSLKIMPLLAVFLISSLPILKSQNQPLSNTGLNFSCDDMGEDNNLLVIFDGLKDWVTGTAYGGGSIVSGNNGAEETRGAITVANKNDTDGDEHPDNEDPSVVASSVGRNEIDLIKLVVLKPTNMDVGETVVLRKISGNIRLWESPTKEADTELQLVNNQTQFIATDLDPNKVLYIEAPEVSHTIRDIVLEAEYNGQKDVVKATAIWATKQRVFHTRGQPNANGIVEDGPPNNLVANAPLPNLQYLDEPKLTNRIENGLFPEETPNGTLTAKGWRSVDGSRYGHGTMTNDGFFEPDDPIDLFIGGRILFEFKIEPENAADLGVHFDITRQKKVRDYVIDLPTNVYGNMPSEDPILFKMDDFPEEDNMDNETANDDENNFDEDSHPNNDLIYVFDSPSTPRVVPGHAGFVISKNTFREFVRVKIDDATFGNGLYGSSMSDKYNWHSVYYIKLGENEVLVEDNTPSYSKPLLRPSNTSIPSGNIQISLSGSPPTRAYKLQYKAGETKWELLDNINNTLLTNVTDTNEMNWVLNDGGVQIQITQTAEDIKFEEGDIIEFFVFTSNNKLNRTEEGFFDVLSAY